MAPARIWFPERQVVEEHEVDGHAAADPDRMEQLTIDGITYLLNTSDDPAVDFVATRKGVA